MEQQQRGILPGDPATYFGPANPGVQQTAFSPDGKLLAAAYAEGYVRLWNPATRQAVGAPLPADPGGGVVSMAFSPDGKLLATADIDGYLRLWDPATHRAVGARVRASTSPQGTGRGGGPSVNGVAFSPDGKLLATVDRGGYVRLWNPATRQD